VLTLSKYTTKINRPNDIEVQEQLNNNGEIKKHKTVSRKENKKSKDE
jgi:hypothetical protein